MAAKWFYSNSGQPVGPMTSQQLKSLVGEGTIRPDTPVIKEGMQEWIPAEQVEGLFAAAPAPPDAPQAPPVPAPQVAPPQAPDGGASVSQVAPAAPGGRTSNTGLIIGASVAGGLLLLVGSVAVGFMVASQSGQNAGSGGSSGETRPLTGDERVVRDLSDEIEQLEEQRDELEKAQERLDADVKKLEEDNGELEKKKRELEAEVQRLVSYIEELKTWQTVDFVMVNSTDFAVGLKNEGNGLVVKVKAAGKQAADAVGVARNVGIPRVDKDHSLARKLYNEAEVDLRVPQPIEADVRRYYRPYRFVMAEPDANPKFVAYHDYELNRMRIGLFRGFEPDALVFHSVGKQPERVTKNRIQPGSLRVATADRIHATLTDRDFLEFCILNVAQKLGSVRLKKDAQKAEEEVLLTPDDPLPDDFESFLSGYVNLSVHAEVDIPREELRLYRQLDRNLAEHTGDKVERFIRRAAGFDEIVRSPIVIPITRERERLFGKTFDPQLLAAVSYLEDEVYEKLSEVGIPTIDNEPLDSEIDLDLNADPFRVAKQKNATHLLVVELKRPSADGQYHLSVRLSRVADRQILWSGEGDRVISTELVGQQYHMSSGQLSVIHLESDTFDDFYGREVSPVIGPVGVAPGNAKYTYLVYKETVDPGSPFFEYRTAFGKIVNSSPVELITQTEPAVDPRQIPSHLVLRYATCRMASRMLPAAGRVYDIDGARARVGIGSREGVKSEDRLVVLRVDRELRKSYQELPSRSAGETSTAGGPTIDERSLTEARSLIPQEVVVTKAFDTYSEVYVAPTGAEEWDPEHAMLQVYDMVVQKTPKTVVLGVVEPRLIPPSPEISRKLGLDRSPVARARAEQNAKSTRDRLADIMRSGLRNLKVPIVIGANQTELRSRGCTHLVVGEITISENTRAISSLSRPLYRVRLALHSASGNRELESFEFDMRDDLRPSR